MVIQCQVPANPFILKFFVFLQILQNLIWFCVRDLFQLSFMSLIELS